MRRYAKVTAPLLLTSAAVVACTESSPCDSTTDFSNGGCIPKAAVADAAALGDGSAAGDGGGAEGGDGGGSVSKKAGDPCADGTHSTDCGPPAPYCAVQPGATTGYCTVTGCDKTPSVCPASWTCFDLSLFSPGAPHICVKP